MKSVHKKCLEFAQKATFFDGKGKTQNARIMHKKRQISCQFQP